MKSFQIRQPTKNDIIKLSDLISQLGYPVTLEAMAQQLEIYIDNSNYLVYVVESNDVVIGVISCVLINYFHKTGYIARITSLIIDKDYRNQGAGKYLVNYLEQYVYKLGCRTIEVTSGTRRALSGTHDFYNKLGYLNVQDEQVYFRKYL